MINFQKERAFFIEKDGEKARPQSFAAVLSTALLIPCAPADDHSSVEHHGHSGPSWAEEEINRASDAGLLSGYLSGDLRGNVTRAQFCEMALQFTAAAQGYGIENYLSLYNVSSLCRRTPAYMLYMVRGI